MPKASTAPIPELTAGVKSSQVEVVKNTGLSNDTFCRFPSYTDFIIKRG